MAAERRLTAILFSDIVGYTPLMGESEERGLRARARHRAVFEAQAERFAAMCIEAGFADVLVEQRKSGRRSVLLVVGRRL